MPGDFEPLQLSKELEVVLERACATVDELESVHVPTVTASSSTSSPGQSPTLTVLGDSIVGLAMTLNADDALRSIKIPSLYIMNTAAVHIHWTKSTNTNDEDKTVRWKVTYTIFNGSSDNVVGTAATVEYEDTYTDSGTTSRIIQRTANIPLVGDIQPRYYIGLKVEAITPLAGTSLSEPILINLDVTYQKRIHSL